MRLDSPTPLLHEGPLSASTIETAAAACLGTKLSSATCGQPSAATSVCTVLCCTKSLYSLSLCVPSVRLGGARASVWTIGQLELAPGAPSIVPARARVVLQFRDADEPTLDALEPLGAGLPVVSLAAPPSDDTLVPAVVRELARIAGISVQEFMVKNDCPCGSTIGPIISTRTGLRTVDLGVACWSMHSIRETIGVGDVENSYVLFRTFFSSFAELDKKCFK